MYKWPVITKWDGLFYWSTGYCGDLGEGGDSAWVVKANFTKEVTFQLSPER